MACLQCHPCVFTQFYSSLCSSIQFLPFQGLTRLKILTNGESKERDYTDRIIWTLGVIILPKYDRQREESNGTENDQKSGRQTIDHDNLNVHSQLSRSQQHCFSQAGWYADRLETSRKPIRGDTSETPHACVNVI